jgi:hypothetical protein
MGVCYGGGHVAALVPVLERLEARDWYCETLALTTAREVIEGRGLRSFGFSDLVVHGGRDTAALAWGTELAEALGASRIPIEESIAYLGLSFADLAGRVGEQAARSEFDERGRAAFLPLDALRRAVDRVEPDVILTTNSPRAERAALHVAAERDIASVSVIDLFGENDDRWAGDFDATTYCVLTEAVADRLARAGVARSRLSITGNPAFDELTRPSVHRSGTELRQRLTEATSGAGRRALVLAAIPPGQDEAFVAWIRDALESAPVDLWLRQHPSSGTVSWRVDGAALVGVEDHLGHGVAAWLHAADVVVTTGSTLSLQAAMIGTPSVLVEGWGPMGFTVDQLSSWAPAHAASTADELHQAVMEAAAMLADAPPVSSGPGAQPSAASKVADVVIASNGRTRTI